MPKWVALEQYHVVESSPESSSLPSHRVSEIQPRRFRRLPFVNGDKEVPMHNVILRVS